MESIGDNVLGLTTSFLCDGENKRRSLECIYAKWINSGHLECLCHNHHDENMINIVVSKTLEVKPQNPRCLGTPAARYVEKKQQNVLPNYFLTLMSLSS